MKVSYSALMQSKFFNPAFNSAIFDGPVRIYFAQSQEALALKVYFCLQQKYSDLLSLAKEIHKRQGRNVLVMIYPSAEAFEMSFETKGDFILSEALMDDDLIGVRGPFEDDQLGLVLDQIAETLRRWNLKPLESRPLELGL